jgi:hypothetical protein
VHPERCLTMSEPSAVSAVMRQASGTLTAASKGCRSWVAAAPLRPPKSAGATAATIPLCCAQLRQCAGCSVSLRGCTACLGVAMQLGSRSGSMPA